ncbi:MAG: hypothetical protein M3Z20_16345 [Chloroflexota bacterium]|nr:hypothetical protein [Chloroflexota bacterium]
MESTQFDDLIRRLSEQVTRRRSLGLLGVLGATGLSAADEALAKGKKKKRKGKGKGKGNGKGGKTTTPQPASPTTAAPDICAAGLGTWCNPEQTCACSFGARNGDPLRCLEYDNVDTATACDDDADCPVGQACGIPVGDPGSMLCGVLCLG